MFYDKGTVFTHVSGGYSTNRLSDMVSSSNLPFIEGESVTGDSVQYFYYDSTIRGEEHLVRVSQSRDMSASPLGYNMILSVNSLKPEVNVRVVRRVSDNLGLRFDIPFPEKVARLFEEGGRVTFHLCLGNPKVFIEANKKRS